MAATAPSECERRFDGCDRVVDAQDGIDRLPAHRQLPRVDPDNGGTGPQRQGDLRERAELAVDGDQHVSGADHEGVAGLAHAGGDGDVHILVGVMAVVRREDADGCASLGLGSSARGLHDTAEPAAQHDRAPLREIPAHLLGNGQGFCAGLSAPDNSHIWSVGRHRWGRVLT